MDWSSLPSDLVAALIGTFVGLLAGLRLDHWLERRRSRLRDERVLQSLINALASKRAFSHPADVKLVDNPEDRDRCIRSVLDARKRAAAVCDEIKVRADVVPTIRAMEVDCIDYLNHVERHELEYAMALVRLRERLFEREQD